jgi:hypothetical protein
MLRYIGYWQRLAHPSQNHTLYKPGEIQMADNGFSLASSLAFSLAFPLAFSGFPIKLLIIYTRSTA